MLMLILAALVGGLSAADLFSIRSIAQQVDRYIASGASTYVIEFKGGISGEACERLSSVDGVLASGALRSKNDKVTSAVLPSAGIPSLDATTGALGVFASSTRSDGATLTVRDYDGIWLSSQAARSVHARAGDRLALRAGGKVRVAGVFQYPDDGRSTSYDYVALSQVPAAADDFDQCLVKAWPVPDAMQSLLQSTVSSWPSDASQQPTISQLNSTPRHAARCRQDIPGEAKRARSRCDVRRRVVRRICRGACSAARTGVSHALRGSRKSRSGCKCCLKH